jgi:predicted CoA-substrate-specific enzyme activase
MPDDVRIGVDVGSRTTKIVVLEGGVIAEVHIFDTAFDPLSPVSEKLASRPKDRLVATGYGRRLLAERLGATVVTEIKACAAGIHHSYPDCRLAVDIGGQDAKVIRITAGGGFEDFELNERCAAGTGRFLEVMARALEYDLDEFCRAAKSADRAVRVNSMCTVFAESEVVALIAGGEARNRIALGIYQSIVERVHPMIARLDTPGDLVFCGGVARSKCLAELLRKKMKRNIHVPPNPQILSALGAALLA